MPSFCSSALWAFQVSLLGLGFDLLVVAALLLLLQPARLLLVRVRWSEADLSAPGFQLLPPSPRLLVFRALCLLVSVLSYPISLRPVCRECLLGCSVHNSNTRDLDGIVVPPSFLVLVARRVVLVAEHTVVGSVGSLILVSMLVAV